MYKQGYHVFCFLIDGKWYRSTKVFDDYEFDRLMDLLSWGMPYNMKAFHFNSNEQPPVSKNPVFEAMPFIDIDMHDLFESRIGVELNRTGRKPAEVFGFSGGLAIIQTNDNYRRLLKNSPDEMSFKEYYPIPFRLAREFVNKHHRHCSAPQSHKFSIGLLHLGRLIGVIITSTPKARALDDGFTLELNRCCVLTEQPNACSKLYASAISAGRKMGYKRFVTYTLTEESGSSLKAVGFKLDGLTKASPKGWDHPSRRRKILKRYPTGKKKRWILTFT